MKKIRKGLLLMGVFAAFSTSVFADINMNKKPSINLSNPTIEPVTEEIIQTDIIVIGGGLSGMSAGLTAAEQGAKVVIFEKLPSLGGAGVYPEGSLGVGTKLQKRKAKEQRLMTLLVKRLIFITGE
ncbi:FAD-dependent oxidoreductase [Budvicia aquatica]|uniref:Coenzyme F420-reducing hydrogenase, delta subunit n=1 Tax=Budvicia aquatica TaxID=82979 RepID=A0A484ZRU3_9GAMM|nr:Coenzyme F420-reducing hydrogenase, delta subunit [Budvicia aquatica]